MYFMLVISGYFRLAAFPEKAAFNFVKKKKESADTHFCGFVNFNASPAGDLQTAAVSSGSLFCTLQSVSMCRTPSFCHTLLITSWTLIGQGYHKVLASHCSIKQWRSALDDKKIFFQTIDFFLFLNFLILKSQVPPTAIQIFYKNLQLFFFLSLFVIASNNYFTFLMLSIQKHLTSFPITALVLKQL